ncbi:MAG: imidazolonepropionase [Arenimonas sp.]
MKSSNGMIINARLATMRHALGAYGLIEQAAIAWRDGIIVYAGPMKDMPELTDIPAHHVEDAHKRWITPALIDCHTHLVFAGDRAVEFERRLEGVSYEQIAREGGGIISTVKQTREASEDELFAQSLPRLQTLIHEGVCALEIKSGYGLTFESERKMLVVARRLAEHTGITIKTTFLGAHALPPEFAGRSDEYVAAVCDWMQRLHQEKLIDAVDAYCEKIAFSVEQTRRVFECAKNLGLPVKLHADQLSDMKAAALCAEFAGLSADHLEYTDEAAVIAMKQANTVAVLLPGSFHCLRETKLPPIALFRKHDVAMAVSTDLNPGTSPLQSLHLAMSLACTHFKLTPEEALRGATVHAAAALGLKDRGQLIAGQRADFVQWNFKHPAELCYWLGGNLVHSIHHA